MAGHLTFDGGREPRTVAHNVRYTKDIISKTEKKEDKVKNGNVILRGYEPTCSRRIH